MENNKDSKVWDIMVRSDYLTEILQQTPIWIIKWGNTLFLFFVLSLFALAAYIKYPDTISAPMELVTQNPPLEVNSKINGKIDTLYFANQAIINEGSLIAKIYSIANYKDVLSLEKFIEPLLNSNDFSKYNNVELPKNLQLGSLGNDYNLLFREFTNLKYFLKQDYTFQKINSLEKEIQKNVQLNSILKGQEEIYTKEIQLLKNNFERYDKLRNDGNASFESVENAEREWLNAKRTYESSKMSQVQNELEIERLEIQKKELLNSRSSETNTQFQRIKELLSTFNISINSWKEDYLIFAPISGILTYDPFLTNESPIISEQTLFQIVPEKQDNKIIGICNMPVRNSGEIQKGNTVQVQLDAFPHQEYGIITGEVNSIARIAQNDNSNNQTFTQLLISFPNGLKTAYGKDLKFTQRMTGRALIVKEKRSLLDRLFDRVLSVFKN